MELEEFQANCNKFRCMRHTLVNKKTCLRESKQNDCFKKWNAKREKDFAKTHKFLSGEYEFIDEVWIEQAGFVPEDRQKVAHWKLYCRFWKCLTPEEQQEFLTRHADYIWMAQQMQVIHLKGRGANPESKKDKSNIVLGNHIAHRLLTDGKDPITLESIGKEEIENWYERMRDGKA